LPGPRLRDDQGTPTTAPCEGKVNMATDTGDQLAQISRELFELVTHVTMAALRGRRRSDDLKELEFLTLTILQEQGTMIVGDIQRLLGVLPAQMSRIIRALEEGDKPLISCRINSTDKRKIDVCLTTFGEKTLMEYQSVRVTRIGKLLNNLCEEDQEDLLRVLEKLNGSLPRVPNKKGTNELAHAVTKERVADLLAETELDVPEGEGRLTKPR
jgi:DNA-binding MarR family transcriptional regulator